MFMPDDAQKILKLSPPTPDKKDKLLWCCNKTRPITGFDCKGWWKLKIHSRHSLLGGKIMHACSPTKDVLLKGSIHIDSSLCAACSAADESTFHLFYLCDVTRSLIFACIGLKLN